MLNAPVMAPVRPDCPPHVAAGCRAGEKGMATVVGYLLARQRLSRPASQTSIGLGCSPLVRQFEVIIMRHESPPTPDITPASAFSTRLAKA